MADLVLSSSDINTLDRLRKHGALEVGEDGWWRPAGGYVSTSPLRVRRLVALDLARYENDGKKVVLVK